MNEQPGSGSRSTRRQIIKGAVAGGLAGLGAGLAGGLGVATSARAADSAQRPNAAFAQKTASEAIKSLYGRVAEESDNVRLDAPEIAENGAVVPVSVSSALPDVRSISLVVSENPFPLAAFCRIPAGTQAAVASRLKIAKTGKLVALVEAGGKLYSATKEVKVTVGGCGG
jgi:sulfur-oxidizing protein SoxY